MSEETAAQTGVETETRYDDDDDAKGASEMTATTQTSKETRALKTLMSPSLSHEA
jgi:hypothetical protein